MLKCTLMTIKHLQRQNIKCIEALFTMSNTSNYTAILCRQMFQPQAKK